MKKVLFVFLATLFLNYSFSQVTEQEVLEIAQNGTEEEILQQNSLLIQNGYLYYASLLTDKLLSFKPESANYNYRKGYLLLATKGDYKNAINYFEKAVKDTDKNFDFFSVKESSAPIDAFYYLGKAYHLNEQLRKSKEYYELFLEKNDNKKSPLIGKAELGLKQLIVAQYNLSHPKSATIINIGNKVNTEAPEYAPVVSLDGQSIYFTSRRKWDNYDREIYRDPITNDYTEDIYVSHLQDNGDWSEPKRLDFCEPDLNEATIAVSADERVIYIYDDSKGGGDIYISKFGNEGFKEIEKLDIEDVNTEYWEPHITMTPDGQYVYFSSDRPGGYGGRDIYRIVKLPNGEWSKAQNMGPEINTPFDEDSPFIAVDNKTIYFSSNGPNSMGGFDIFVSFIDENKQWTTPVNMGVPFNSCGDDIYYTTTVDGLKGYFSSYREGGYGEKDIYEVKNDYLGNRPISYLTGRIIGGDENLSIDVKCVNCVTQEIIQPRIKNGNYFAVLKRCKDYEIILKNEEGKVLETKYATTLCNNENEEISRNFNLLAPQLSITVLDAETNAPIENAKVDIENFANNVSLAKSTSSTGKLTPEELEDIMKDIKEQLKLNIKISHDDYLTGNFNVDQKIDASGNIDLVYKLQKADINTLITLNPIYFDLDKSNIRPDAAKELDKIVKLMNDNPNLEIELSSHTDCRASKAYNMALSNRRAKSTLKYIQSRISNPKRIYGKGYGESRLVNNCACEGKQISDCSEEEHQMNRRTEFKIIKR